ncbi:MAG TPA: hypothetical protein VGY30_03765 [Solirubrobacteraceae bacterium]|jgi:hypothetical protein|nr:hypothetical protein [Solirubrobacteraceae bacterium]
MDRKKRWMTGRIVGVLLATGALMGVLAAPSEAAAGSGFKLYLEQADTALAGEYVEPTVTMTNVGSTTSGPLTIIFTIGAGLEFVPAEQFSGVVFEGSGLPAPCEPLEIVGSTAKCHMPTSTEIQPSMMVHLKILTKVRSGASGSFTNSVTVEGGEMAHPLSEEAGLSVEPRGPFAFDSTAAELLGVDGSLDTQAASDPAEFTTSLKFKSFAFHRPEITNLISGSLYAADGHIKDVTANLPAGLIGNPTTTPLCTAAELASEGGLEVPSCPADSQVGVVYLSLDFSGGDVPLYNMVPPPGAATELGFNFLNTLTLLDAYVRPGDHGITVVSRNAPTTVSVRGVDVTVWGSPADESHDRFRGYCLGHGSFNGAPCHAVTAQRKAFLRLPTSCPGSPLQFAAKTNSYEDPSSYIESSFTTPTLHNCGYVPFEPGIDVEPTGRAANSPTGVSVKVSLQQSSNPEGLQEADLKKAVVTLPEGMALNPSAADGLQACTDTQLKVDSNDPAECPDESKVGTVLLHTPLLSEPVEGNVFVLSQNSNDPASGEMFRLAMELKLAARGIDIKLAGHVAADPKTGRLTATFDENPQFPFNDVSLQFKAGARAPLTTPASCQPQTTEADLYSWAEPTIPVHRSMTFQLTSGPEGTPCVSQPGFNPGFSAGVSSVQAGGFTPFLTTFVRHDSDQSMQKVSVKLPLGVSGSLTGLPLCPEAQASTGMCSQASEIGSVTAGAGSGPTPFYVTGGKVFMTGPYEGSPFGLSIVVPAKAGPYNLGNVNVRARVEVDPHTAQLTVTSDPLPQIVSGVPVNIRLVNVTINRPGFTFNPTSCNPLSVTGTMTGGQGTVASVSDHFQVTNCGALAFKPVFKVSTPGKTSRKNGAGLDVKLSYPSLAFGKDANIAKVKVDLPKQLPSRLTTLQKACTAKTFEANPAACPAASRVGTATARTPIIPVPLSGPVYFVSHGGEAFPNLVIVLQGYGVTVDLVGDTFINEKTNVTSTTFKTIPDVPVGSFELKLPQGPNSALAAIGNLCTSKLKMPTLFVAQDGAEIHQATPIGVTGCAKNKAKKHHGKAKGK